MSMSVNVGNRDAAVHVHDDENNAEENLQINNNKYSICKSSESSASVSSSDAEFFDAPDPTLNDYGGEEDVTQPICMQQPHSNSYGPGLSSTAQLRLEIQRRVKAEEALMILQQQQDKIARKLSTAGLFLPSDENLATSSMRLTSADWDFSNQIKQKLIIARLTTSAVTRGVVKVEIEERLDALLANKNCEISRLQEKLQSYELVNHKMSERNQELIGDFYNPFLQ
ncbi:hypothetical protein O6H91_01G125700 [Diphasiastrum complanatum]|uniref:Uncharacterized protein n=1 Tax=Diphasiastrum complanatum TaxID=34168 RepID=A0ACC2EVQ4_DIPCM|nr:hypothetical protein O6H91_01G125700 [Diphasiastrum complanatum]